MSFNLDFGAALRSVLGAPPLIGASLAVAAMVLLWLSSKLLRFAQIGLGAMAVFFLVRFALAGGGAAVPVPVAAPVPAEVSAATAASDSTSTPATPEALGAPVPGLSEIHIDSTGFTVHVPFGAVSSVQALLQNNQTAVQRALAPAPPGGTPTDPGQKAVQATP